VFFTAFSVSAAFAQKKPRIVRLALVDVDGNTTSESTDIHYFVEKGIRLSGAKVQLMPLDDVLNAGANATEIQNLAFGKEALEAGMKAFNAGDCDEAVDQLSQAVTYFEQSMAFLDNPDDYIAALTHQGVCLSRTGSTKAALQVLQKVFVVKPKLKFDSFDREKPIFSKARELVSNRDLSSVTVTTTPDASRVFVNGRYRGTAPAYRPGLRRGVHFVRVERQGYGRSGLKLDTMRGNPDAKTAVTVKSARRKAALETLLPGLQKEIGAPEAGPVTSRLQGLLLVDYVVLYRASGPATAKSVELSLYDLVSSRLLNKVEGKVDWDARNKPAKNAVLALAKELLDVELQTLVKIDDPPINGGGKTPAGGIATKWWFWTAIGAVVLGGTVGLIVALQPEDERTGLNEDGNGAFILRF